MSVVPVASSADHACDSYSPDAGIMCSSMFFSFCSFASAPLEGGTRLRDGCFFCCSSACERMAATQDHDREMSMRTKLIVISSASE